MIYFLLPSYRHDMNSQVLHSVLDIWTSHLYHGSEFHSCRVFRICIQSSCLRRIFKFLLKNQGSIWAQILILLFLPEPHCIFPYLLVVQRSFMALKSELDVHSITYPHFSNFFFLLCTFKYHNHNTKPFSDLHRCPKKKMKSLKIKFGYSSVLKK